MFWRKAKIFSKIKKSLQDFIDDYIKSPFSWSNILWDPYITDDISTKIMRFAKVITLILTLLRVLNAVFIGLYLAIDGIYSIYKYRFEIKLTKSWIEDLPKIARIFLGILVMLNFNLLL